MIRWYRIECMTSIDESQLKRASINSIDQYISLLSQVVECTSIYHRVITIQIQIKQLRWLFYRLPVRRIIHSFQLPTSISHGTFSVMIHFFVTKRLVWLIVFRMVLRMVFSLSICGYQNLFDLFISLLIVMRMILQRLVIDLCFYL